MRKSGDVVKRLLLLRHAKSAQVARMRDHARPLEPRGIWAAETLAEHCAKRLKAVDVALCSSAIRARETLRLVERHLPPSCKSALDDGLYMADRLELMKRLRCVDDRFQTALLVGHEPGLTDLAEAVCAGRGNGKALRRLAKGLKTSSLATIDLPIESWTGLEPGTGRLRAVIRPKDLA